MKGKMLVLVAVVVGLVAVFLVNSRFDALEARANPPTRTFYRAASAILPGVTVGEAMSDQRRFLQSATLTEDFARAHPDAVDEAEIEWVKKLAIARPVPAGEYLRMSHLEPVSATEIRARIPEGHVAVGISANQDTAVGYLIAPGDIVDVYVALTRNDREKPGGVAVDVQKIAGNVLVFSTGANVRLTGGTPPRSARGDTYNHLTLAAPPADVENIIRYRALGKLTLVLASRKPE